MGADQEEPPGLLARAASVWRSIADEGVVLAGRPLAETATLSAD
jgi:hypothetical protein